MGPGRASTGSAPLPIPSAGRTAHCLAHPLLCEETGCGASLHSAVWHPRNTRTPVDSNLCSSNSGLRNNLRAVQESNVYNVNKSKQMAHQPPGQWPCNKYHVVSGRPRNKAENVQRWLRNGLTCRPQSPCLQPGAPGWCPLGQGGSYSLGRCFSGAFPLCCDHCLHCAFSSSQVLLHLPQRVQAALILSSGPGPARPPGLGGSWYHGG